MPTYTKFNFAVDLGVVCSEGDSIVEDRQFAWELYCELVSRTALIGRENGDGEQVLDGELMVEGLESVREFVDEARRLMRRYPAGAAVAAGNQRHLGFFIASLIEIVLRPFLDKWWPVYRQWWLRVCSCAKIDDPAPLITQQEFPHYQDLVVDWKAMRTFCRSTARELSVTFALPDVLALEPPGLKDEWVNEIKHANQGV